jgi:hypothetical protein
VLEFWYETYLAWLSALILHIAIVVIVYHIIRYYKVPTYALANVSNGLQPSTLAFGYKRYKEIPSS